MEPMKTYLLNSEAQLTLKPGNWYAWQMLPGYGSGLEGYFSPIYVQRVQPPKSGKQQLRLVFLNARYAQGVQNFTVKLRVLARRQNHLLASLIEAEDARDVVISHITQTWLEHHMADLLRLNPPSQFPECLAQHELHYYLNKLFFRALRPGEALDAGTP